MCVGVDQRRNQSSPGQLALVGRDVGNFQDLSVESCHTDVGPWRLIGQQEPAKMMNPAVVHVGVSGILNAENWRAWLTEPFKSPQKRLEFASILDNAHPNGDEMEVVSTLVDNIVTILGSLLQIIWSLLTVIGSWAPLLAWIGFWGLAVNWVRAWDIIRRGGFIGVLLLMVVWVMVWAAVSPGPTNLFGLTVSNYPGKFVWVTGLTVIAGICGSVQMSGGFGRLACFASEEAEPAADAH